MKKASKYVDGFLIPVPKSKVSAYVKVAKAAAKLWLDHGAIEYVECAADDVKPGKLTSFPQAVKLKKNEVVFFSWITYKSRAHRDRVLAKVMADPRFEKMMLDVPFEGKRMMWGGFKPVVSAETK